MENSLRMVLSSCLIEESLSLDLPFFSRLSTVLDQMGLQAVKQGQITDNWQKRGPWLLIEDNQSLSCDHASPFTSIWALLWRDQWQIQPLSFAAAGTFPIPAPALYHQTPFFLLLSWVAAHSQTPSQTLWHWIRSVWICQFVFRRGCNPRFSLQQTGVWASHTGSDLKTQLQGNTSKWNGRFIQAENAVFP